MDIKNKVVILLMGIIPMLLQLIVNIESVPNPDNGLCIFGNASNCYFPCRCLLDSCDTMTGECPYGKCQKGWTGKYCQYGNVAQGKPVYKNVKDLTNTISAMPGTTKVNTLGGPNQECATISPWNIISAGGLRFTFEYYSVLWMIDLGKVYKISVVSLIFRNMFGAYSSQNMKISANSEKSQNLSAQCIDFVYHIYGIDSSMYTLRYHCPEPVIGRYISVFRVKDRFRPATPLGLCEIDVTGYLYVPVDWSRCTDGLYDKFCTKCSGSMPPDCRKSCSLGKFGTNCENTCDNCNKHNGCDPASGECIDECEQWFISFSRKCDTEIKSINLENEEVILKNTSVDLVELQFNVPSSVDCNLSDNYFIEIDYKVDGAAEFVQYSSFGQVPLCENNHTTLRVLNIPNLSEYTTYKFQIVVIRHHRSIYERGKPSHSIKAATHMKCPTWFITNNKECDTQIPNIHLSNKSLLAQVETGINWIEFSLKVPKKWVRKILRSYYSLMVEYKHNEWTEFRAVLDIRTFYGNTKMTTLSFNLTSLEDHTMYIFQCRIIRNYHYGITDMGAASNAVRIETKSRCATDNKDNWFIFTVTVGTIFPVIVILLILILLVCVIRNRTSVYRLRSYEEVDCLAASRNTVLGNGVELRSHSLRAVAMESGMQPSGYLIPTGTTHDNCPSGYMIPTGTTHDNRPNTYFSIKYQQDTTRDNSTTSSAYDDTEIPNPEETVHIYDTAAELKPWISQSDDEQSYIIADDNSCEGPPMYSEASGGNDKEEPAGQVSYPKDLYDVHFESDKNLKSSTFTLSL